MASADVEQVLSMHVAVAEAAVVAVAADEGGEDEIKACLVLAANVSELDVAAFWAWCDERLPYFAVPRYLQVLDALPKTPTEKVIKHELREQRGRDGLRPRPRRAGEAMRIAVVGAGAVGSVYGALLARSGHEVTLVDVAAEQRGGDQPRRDRARRARAATSRRCRRRPRRTPPRPAAPRPCSCWSRRTRRAPRRARSRRTWRGRDRGDAPERARQRSRAGRRARPRPGRGRRDDRGRRAPRPGAGRGLAVGARRRLAHVAGRAARRAVRRARRPRGSPTP